MTKMTKMTTPIAILIGSLLIAIAIFLRVDITDPLIADANAKVAEMDSWDLKNDYDFKKAVQEIVESCEIIVQDEYDEYDSTFINNENGYIECYIDDNIFGW